MKLDQNPRRCPECNRMGMVYETRGYRAHVRRSRKCNCGARWVAREEFVKSIDRVAKARHTQRTVEVSNA